MRKMRTVIGLFLCLVCVSAIASAQTLLSVEVKPTTKDVYIGTSFEVAISTVPSDGQPFDFWAAQVLITYNPSIIRLTGAHPVSYDYWYLPLLPNDGYGINQDIGDGEALLLCWEPWYGPPHPQAPMTLAHLVFTAVGLGSSAVSLDDSHGTLTTQMAPDPFGGTCTGDIIDGLVRVWAVPN